MILQWKFIENREIGLSLLINGSFNEKITLLYVELPILK